ncbi:hypothetical protein [Caldicellulosiruptor morganii]|uniref:Phosphoesterase PA-phosphatase related protein n=1 Tax=Caldicellulosiruptor morganii TaxID=1387555 RepID=A0ABY7BP97_9FIRM|nr:hypothetical protein [Caldicellulosiruptor morganii]WAM34355.1 hypothetical protein OTK00_000540 [Caldicellulosiruptor morganii]
MREKIAYLISSIFTVPMVALIVFTIMWFDNKAANYNGNFNYYLSSILFFTIIPIMAYIVARTIPKFKSGGREKERKLAFIFGIAGYILGNLSLLVMKRPTKAMVGLYLSYLISSFILAFINRVLKFKASGHACGITGPVLAVNFIAGIKMWFLFLLIPLVMWSRLVLKRHDFKQLIVGAATSFVVTLVIMMCIY